MASISLPFADAGDATRARLRGRFSALIATYGRGIRRVARAHASAADVPDVEQEIALALWNALPSFREECSERTFVYRIAHNRAISHGVARRCRDRVTPVAELPKACAPGPAADEAIANARRREALFDAIARLDDGARTVLTLALEGLSHADIAEIVGTSAGNVAVRLSRARAEIRTLLEVRRGDW